LRASGILSMSLSVMAPASLCAACSCSFALRSASVCVRLSIVEKAESIPIDFAMPDALLPSMAPERAQREGRYVRLPQNVAARAQVARKRVAKARAARRLAHGTRDAAQSCPRLGSRAPHTRDLPLEVHHCGKSQLEDQLWKEA
jgi:hypothetical protein